MLTTLSLAGISHIRSEVGRQHVRDGTSKTYMIGEKHIDPEHYMDGWDLGDDWAMYTGQQDDVYRTTYYNVSDPDWNSAPVKDTVGASQIIRYGSSFGSAHSSGVNFVFCDGSVRMINFSIDPERHRRLGNRQDGLRTQIN